MVYRALGMHSPQSSGSPLRGERRSERGSMIDRSLSPGKRSRLSATGVVLVNRETCPQPGISSR